ncbi:Uncharacterised protein [Enterobacter asburiae]|uniref:Uncharacterized protein n=1 Tax=Enterobacter asburiae TaxID=61645 RepID=A0A376FCX8_ENTAS|nr:Uncharacterised protein [Enterobacter asburiae]
MRLIIRTIIALAIVWIGLLLTGLWRGLWEAPKTQPG